MTPQTEDRKIDSLMILRFEYRFLYRRAHTQTQPSDIKWHAINLNVHRIVVSLSKDCEAALREHTYQLVMGERVNTPSGSAPTVSFNRRVP